MGTLYTLYAYAKATALPFQCHSRDRATAEQLFPWVTLNDDSLLAFTDRQLLISAVARGDMQDYIRPSTADPCQSCVRINPDVKYA